jgi:hypothetical protein
MVKINIDAILNTSLGVLLAAGVGALALLVANRLFGVFSYPSLTPDQVDKVAKEYDRRYRIVSRACDSTHCRGIYDMGGSLYYYSWEFGKSYTTYPLLFERYSTDFSLGDKPPLVYP